MKQFFAITIFLILIFSTTAISQIIPPVECVTCRENNAFIHGRTTTNQFTFIGDGAIRRGLVLTALNEFGDAYWEEPPTGIGSASLWEILNKNLYTFTKVGIGTDSPDFDLHVVGTTFTESLRVQPHLIHIKEGDVLTAIDSFGNVAWRTPSSGISIPQQCISCDGGTVNQENSASILGINNTATGIGAIAGGVDSEALGDYSVALGYSAIANDFSSIAIGRNVTSEVPNASVLGYNLQTYGSKSFVIGAGYNSENRLVNLGSSTMMIGFMSTAPTLFISRSITTDSYKDRTGKVGIGNVTQPESKLHIKADDNENAELYLQSHVWNSSSLVSIFMGNKQNSINVHGQFGMMFNTENNYLFGDGNVGIGLGLGQEPEAKLHVNGTILTNGFSMPQNGMSDGWVLTADHNGNAIWEPTQSLSLWGYNEETGDIYRSEGNVGIGVESPRSSLEVHGQISIGFNTNAPPDENNLIVEGNVGIGTWNPTAELDVEGKIKTTGFQLLNGQLNGNILQCDNEGNATWVDPSMINDGDWTQLANNLYVDPDRNVGIGTNTPTQPLDVVGNMKISGEIYGGHIDAWPPLRIFAGTNENNGSYISLSGNGNNKASIKLFARGTSGSIQFFNYQHQIMTIRADNNVYVGNVNVESNLVVYGEVKAHILRATAIIDWHDYVFEDDYKLMPLNELEKFVNEHHHLPDMPTEEQVHEDGLDIAEMNALLLKKVEELTLYVIELKKENEGIREEINNIKGE